MARSNIGGTRSFIRGKVANDIYQVGYNMDGKKQQFIKAAADHVTNPNTKYQALARMQMALLMGTMGQFSTIIDHSWEGIPYGQMSIAYFVKKNMELLQADCKNHWFEDNEFEWRDKGSRMFRRGKFYMSEGSLSLPSCIHVIDSGYPRYIGTMQIRIGKQNATFGDLKAALGANVGDYITYMEVLQYEPTTAQNYLVFNRLYLADGISDDTVITEQNVSSMFTHEGNEDFQMTYAPNSGTIGLQNVALNNGAICPRAYYTVIVSKWTGTIWARNTARFDFMPTESSPPWSDTEPYSVFQSWWPDYDGESYAELFPDK